MNLYLVVGGAEVTLWQNPSQATYGSSTVTLSDDISKYDYLKFVFWISYNGTSTVECIYDAKEFTTKEFTTKFKPSYGNFYYRGCAEVINTSNSFMFFRQFFYNTDTTISIRDCVYINGASTTWGNESTMLIPKEIIGGKYY